MKDKHLWKFRKISGNDLEIVLNSVFYNLRLKRQLFINKDTNILILGKSFKDKNKKCLEDDVPVFMQKQLLPHILDRRMEI